MQNSSSRSWTVPATSSTRSSLSASKHHRPCMHLVLSTHVLSDFSQSVENLVLILVLVLVIRSCTDHHSWGPGIAGTLQGCSCRSRGATENVESSTTAGTITSFPGFGFTI
ncbi:hypothetical protein HRR83_006321 [Exophiala dermatitidis]|uniref:Uncharacterized protein n=1 Tax=Exophiala dermatitidis TaxID=5970 RepID=A0AAN6ENA3_EXODE|nr:hypothetical protein HRR73_007179 [Exophiala dermatitidis]KAJ4509512.1 hypothetical protein HRR74_007293 [Exophiala dermatitidis]KAJ4530512.1 hypothetical protein HRR76_008221 [Exophiala dermatitidis]KAJ4545319.1 hypothetical protein HRR77_005166 [Exophiala dermatitidis]KAJ4570878.1 hypothetical protein HRR79_003807 [Exophiala dermatitidis]